MLTNLHFKLRGFIENLFIHLTWLQSNIYCFVSQSIQLVLPEYNSKITISHIQVFNFKIKLDLRLWLMTCSIHVNLKVTV